MKIKVFVTLKEGILDPQGKAIEGALQRIGYKEAKDVRVGKLIELTVEGTSKAEVGKRVQEMCEKLLSNPVIENARYELAE